jgi:hypothetical protein
VNRIETAGSRIDLTAEIDRLILAVKSSRPVGRAVIYEYIMENYDPRYMYQRPGGYRNDPPPKR